MLDAAYLFVFLAKFGGNYAKFAKSIDYDFSLGILCLNRLAVRRRNAKFAKKCEMFSASRKGRTRSEI